MTEIYTAPAVFFKSKDQACSPDSKIAFTGKIENIFVVTDEGKENESSLAHDLQVQHSVPVVTIGAGEILMHEHDQEFKNMLTSGIIVFTQPLLYTDTKPVYSRFEVRISSESLYQYLCRGIANVPHLTAQKPNDSEQVWKNIATIASDNHYQLTSAA